MEISDLYRIFTEYPVICTDSRNIIPDSIFFALKGNNFDGNKYVEQALLKGCAYAVSDDISNAELDGCIVVENVLQTLSELAKYHRNSLNVHVLAITGTNGKTTTKELVGAVLSKRYKTVCTMGNQNNHIGVPLSLLSMPADTEIAVIETGANHCGEIAALCEIACPNSGIITNIGKAHIEGFGSAEGVRKAKSELYNYLEKHRGTIFYNSDDETLTTMAEKTSNTVLVPYGAKAMDVETASGTFLAFGANRLSLNVQTSLVGEYNLNNALAAVAVGLYFDVSVEDIADALAAFKPENNRSQLIETSKNTVIMDAYNANPSSMEAALTNFAKLDKPNKLLILGDMLELGTEAHSEHKKIIELTQKLGFENIIFVGSNFYELKDKSISIHFSDSIEARKYLSNNNISVHTILVKGSRGIGLEKLLAEL
ncbi:MAG: UDP-N-acetylmuramoyl-tripeptide--D-alanyl-D-alanine ligase [Prevotellaceae bacterium]|jgi:UDP-N-acetylmuramoyl-tripeptide--D-alanyl-D-alanine ligase|nr:UDP-N-acetylmuramoyl-tripeptide--D-alanyl-D-alanine ligase [Prevotellaceae bacterium]